MPLKKFRFADLDPGQVFLSQQNGMYRKLDEQAAELIRLRSGQEPNEKTVTSFPPDECVELVPTGKDRNN